MSKKRIKADPGKIHLCKVEVLSEILENDADQVITPGSVNDFKFDVQVNSGMYPEEKSVYHLFEVAVVPVLEEGQTTSARGLFRFGFTFRVSNLTDLVQITADQETMDGNLAVTLVSIAYSTLRGYLLAKTQGTFLSGLILPVIDPRSLLGITAAAEQPAR